MTSRGIFISPVVRMTKLLGLFEVFGLYEKAKDINTHLFDTCFLVIICQLEVFLNREIVMASFNQRAIKWIDYIKENCIDALKKYCEDQASNDLTAEEKQDARDYLENYIKTEVTKHFGCGVDDDHPYAIDDNGTDQEALENIVMEVIFIYNNQKERVFDRLRKSFES